MYFDKQVRELLGHEIKNCLKYFLKLSNNLLLSDLIFINKLIPDINPQLSKLFNIVNIYIHLLIFFLVFLIFQLLFLAFSLANLLASSSILACSSASS